MPNSYLCIKPINNYNQLMRPKKIKPVCYKKFGKTFKLYSLLLIEINDDLISI